MLKRLPFSSNRVQHVIVNAIRNASQQPTYKGPAEKCMNSVKILGRVGQEPVTRGENGTFVTFSVATSRSYPKPSQEGTPEYVTKTEWHNVCVFRPFLVERVQKQVSKGTRILVSGSIEYVDYEKSDGSRMAMTRIVPDDIFVLSPLEEK